MAAGRPPLRIGAHGKITRQYLGGGVWLARCRYRDTDGVTRIVQRLGPADEHDQHGKLAEDMLVEALTARRPPTAADTVGLDTPVMALVDAHIARLAEDGRAARTIDTYRLIAAWSDRKWMRAADRSCRCLRVWICGAEPVNDIHLAVSSRP